MKIGVGRVSLLFIALVVIPASAHAQVVINEFLYDAPGTDTDQEYVELYNAGSSAVDLTKWKISDGSNHTFNVPPKNGGTGSITLSPGAFALLVDNASNFLAAHAGLPGTVIDTVLSLPNVNGTIALLDDSGATVDSVSYTKDQGANGDGNSLQKSSGVWIAASPTPNAVNATSPGSSGSDSNTQTQAATTQSSSNSSSNSTASSASPIVSSYVPPPVPQVFADAGNDRTVIVGADTEFDGRAYNRDKEIVEHVRFVWNFGDGSTADGPAVLHHYDYPGRYALMLTVAENKDAVSDEVIVTAEPAKLAFSTYADGGVAIENRAGRDLDLSGWLIRQYGELFTLPEHSVILSGESLRISQKTLKFWSSAQTELDYPNGVPALQANQSSVESSVTPVSVPAPVAHASPPVYTIAKSAQTADMNASPELSTESATGTDVSSDTQMQAQTAAAALSGGWYWWIGAIALAVVVSGSVYALRRVRSEEWDITEEA